MIKVTEPGTIPEGGVDPGEQGPGHIPEWKGIEAGDDVIIPDETDTPAAGEPPAGTPPAGTEPPAGTPKPNFDGRTGDLVDADGNPIVDPDTPPGGDETPPDPNESPEEVIFSEVANLLKGKGFFAGVEKIEDIKSPDLLASALDEEVKARLTDRQKEIMEYMNNGVPVQQVSKYKTALDEANTVTPQMLQENIEMAKTLVVADLTYKKVDPETVQSIVTMMETNGTLVPEATKALTSRRETLQGLITSEVNTAKQAKKAEQDLVQARALELDKKLNSTEVFKRKISQATIDKVKKLASTPVGYTAKGEPLNAVMQYRQDNPIDFEHKLNYLFAVTNGFESLDAFDRSAESRVSSRMRSAVQRMSASPDISNNNKTVDKTGTVIDMDTIDDVI